MWNDRGAGLPAVSYVWTRSCFGSLVNPTVMKPDVDRVSARDTPICLDHTRQPIFEFRHCFFSRRHFSSPTVFNASEHRSQRSAPAVYQLLHFCGHYYAIVMAAKVRHHPDRF
jgi:hypothetical protein